MPINQCLNSKIQSEHTFNYDTESGRLPTNNPEYNAALYDWSKYTGDQQVGAYLQDATGAGAESAIEAMAPEGSVGPAKIK